MWSSTYGVVAVVVMLRGDGARARPPPDPALSF